MPWSNSPRHTRQVVVPSRNTGRPTPICRHCGQRTSGSAAAGSLARGDERGLLARGDADAAMVATARVRGDSSPRVSEPAAGGGASPARGDPARGDPAPNELLRGDPPAATPRYSASAASSTPTGFVTTSIDSTSTGVLVPGAFSLFAFKAGANDTVWPRELS